MKQKILSIMLAVCMLFTAAACGSTASAPAEEGFKPALDKETAAVVDIAGHYSNFEALEDASNRFAEYYPNIQIKYTALDNYNKILATVMQGKDAPDIFFTFPWMMESADYESVFAMAEDLSDPQLGFDLSCIRSGLLSTDSEGHTPIVPIYTTTFGMLVNEDLFEKEKLEVPGSFSELIQVCEAFKNAGYKSPVMGYSNNNFLLYSLYYPHFCAGLAGNEEAVRALNEMQPSAAEYLRPSLELVADFMGRGFIDIDSCNALENDYNAVIMRFFEGDVPMMLGSASTVSGTEKRESQSEAFSAHPFKYRFYPVPSTDNGGYFLNTIALGFSVNKESADLAAANEFMRFLISTEELNNMAEIKRMVTPCKDMLLDDVYAPFGALDAERIINPSLLGLQDAADLQARLAGLMVNYGKMSVDEAIAAFGTLE
ncbi:MAG: carbohydrate ABC transporter substrate-binding protein [Firmicutes bacterium]|nr:carbohydrate ABC transporter substrate-binding protein [Bacillota bacterium]